MLHLLQVLYFRVWLRYCSSGILPVNAHAEVNLNNIAEVNLYNIYSLIFYSSTTKLSNDVIFVSKFYFFNNLSLLSAVFTTKRKYHAVNIYFKGI